MVFDLEYYSERTERARAHYEAARDRVIGSYEIGSINIREFDRAYRKEVLPLKENLCHQEQCELVRLLSKGIDIGHQEEI